ncbi:MAG: hypothetical protein ACLSVD_02260 [Eggerthellaceae bacterium]
MSANNLTRRTFVIGGAALVASVAVGARRAAFVAEADALRPPGALRKTSSAARCIKCARCIDVCPYRCAGAAGHRARAAASPHADAQLRNDSLTFCDKCREVCPTAAIGEVIRTRRSGAHGAAILHEYRCRRFWYEQLRHLR